MRRLKALWLASIVLLLFTACGGDSSNDDGGGNKPTPASSGNSFVMGVKLTRHDVTTVVESDSAKAHTSYINTWGESSKAQIIGKQGDLVEDFGSVTVKSVTENVLGNFEVDLSKSQLNTKSSIDYYGFFSGMKGGVKDGRVYYDASQRRGFAPGYWFKASSNSTTATAQLCGVTEILYITNKTSNQILVTHNGFDTDEKWYYPKALIDVADNSIFETGDGNEVTTTGQFIAPNVMKSIITTYAPTGKAINNAQLICNISGTVVHSVNRISSDIVPQIGHIYAIYATWDGKKLVLGDKVAEVHVLSDNNESDIQVDELQYDGTLILQAEENAIPQEGDILVSGITDKAPQGFMYKVKEVIQTSSTRAGSKTKCEVKTENACLNEVLPNCKDYYPVEWGNNTVRSVRDAYGRPVGFHTRATKDITLLEISLDKEFVPEAISGGNGSYISVKPNFTIGLYASLYANNEDHVMKKFGLDIKGSINGDLTCKMGFKYKKTSNFTLYTIDLEPVTIMIGPVPVVLTPKINIDVDFTVSGEAFYSIKPVDGELSTKVSLYYTDEINQETNSHYHFEMEKTLTSNFFFPSDCFGTKFNVNDLAVKIGAENNNMSLGFKAGMKLAFTPLVNFSFYNLNKAAYIGVGPSAYVAINGELSIKPFPIIIDDEPDVKDQIDVECGGEIKGDVNLNFSKVNALSWLGGKWSYTINLMKFTPWTLASLFTLYDKMEVDVKENVLEKKTIKLSVEKKDPSWKLFQEIDFGFCYAVEGETMVGEKPDWHYISLASKYPHYQYGLSQTLDMTHDLETSLLKPNKKYTIRPYSKFKNVFGQDEHYITRKGIHITTGGNGSGGTGTLENVPGTEL